MLLPNAWQIAVFPFLFAGHDRGQKLGMLRIRRVSVRRKEMEAEIRPTWFQRRRG